MADSQELKKGDVVASVPPPARPRVPSPHHKMDFDFAILNYMLNFFWVISFRR